MAQDTYTVVSWQPTELITETKMDSIGDNLQWLYEHMPRATYNAWSVNQSTGVKIVSGVATIPPDANGAYLRNVYFGDVFSTGCRPNVTTGIYSDSTRRVHVTLSGFGVIYPDQRGFRIYAYSDNFESKNRKFTKSWHVAWTAVGY